MYYLVSSASKILKEVNLIIWFDIIAQTSISRVSKLLALKLIEKKSGYRVSQDFLIYLLQEIFDNQLF